MKTEQLAGKMIDIKMGKRGQEYFKNGSNSDKMVKYPMNRALFPVVQMIGCPIKS
jgi:hypothetical protein